MKNCWIFLIVGIFLITIIIWIMIKPKSIELPGPRTTPTPASTAYISDEPISGNGNCEDKIGLHKAKCGEDENGEYRLRYKIGDKGLCVEDKIYCSTLNTVYSKIDTNQMFPKICVMTKDSGPICKHGCIQHEDVCEDGDFYWSRCSKDKTKICDFYCNDDTSLGWQMPRGNCISPDNKCAPCGENKVCERLPPPDDVIFKARCVIKPQTTITPTSGPTLTANPTPTLTE